MWTPIRVALVATYIAAIVVVSWLLSTEAKAAKARAEAAQVAQETTYRGKKPRAPKHIFR